MYECHVLLVPVVSLTISVGCNCTEAAEQTIHGLKLWLSSMEHCILLNLYKLAGLVSTTEVRVYGMFSAVLLSKLH